MVRFDQFCVARTSGHRLNAAEVDIYDGAFWAVWIPAPPLAGFTDAGLDALIPLSDCKLDCGVSDLFPARIGEKIRGEMALVPAWVTAFRCTWSLNFLCALV
jgi:hypothetical protein